MLSNILKSLEEAATFTQNHKDNLLDAVGQVEAIGANITQNAPIADTIAKLDKLHSDLQQLTGIGVSAVSVVQNAPGVAMKTSEPAPASLAGTAMGSTVAPLGSGSGDGKSHTETPESSGPEPSQAVSGGCKRYSDTW